MPISSISFSVRADSVLRIEGVASHRVPMFAERGGDAEDESGPLWQAQAPRGLVGVLDHPGRVTGHVGLQAARHHRHGPDRPQP
jgi:hypothetical protein